MKFKQIMTWGKYMVAIGEDGSLTFIEIVPVGMPVPAPPSLATHQIHFHPAPQQQRPTIQ